MEQQLIVAEPPETSSQPQPALKTPRLWQRLTRSPLVMIGLAFGLALVMWMVDFQPVSSDATKLTVAYEPTASDGDLLNLKSSVWDPNHTNSLSKEIDLDGKPTNKISTTVIPLSAQYIAPQQGGSLLQVQARAAFNDKTMAVLVQWQDDSKNVATLVNKQQYSDAVALEFPVKLVAGHQPFRCMGQTDAQVNIWQWKAEREAAVAGDARIVVGAGGKAVKSYLGPGIGYLKDAADAEPDSTAAYDDTTKTWSVIFRRSLTSKDELSATQFTPGQATLIAFAVWNGGAGERLSKKAVSTWVDFILQPGETNTQSLINILTLGGLGALALVVIVITWRLLPSTKRSSRE